MMTAALARPKYTRHFEVNHDPDEDGFNSDGRPHNPCCQLLLKQGQYGYSRVEQRTPKPPGYGEKANLGGIAACARAKRLQKGIFSRNPLSSATNRPARDISSKRCFFFGDLKRQVFPVGSIYPRFLEMA